MTNKNYEVLDTYTFNRFIGLGSFLCYAEYKSEKRFLGLFTWYDYIHILVKTVDAINPYVCVDSSKYECGSEVSYKPYGSDFGCGTNLRDLYKKDRATLSTSVQNRCPKTILRVNYKKYEYKHVLYPNKIIYIEGDE